MKKKTWKQIIALVLALILVCPTVNLNVDANDTAEQMPELYFDLEFENGVAKDAQNNTTVTSIGNGKVEKKIFEIDGKSYEVDAYSADKYVEGDHSYLKLQMNDVTTFAQMEEWILSGITFECYVWVEEIPTATLYYMGNMLPNGGLALTTRKKTGALNFQMSSTKPDTGRFKYDSMFVTAFPSPNKVTDETHADYELAQQYKKFDVGQLNHIVGTYDKETNMMSVYKNGELIGSGDYGTGNLESGKASAGYITAGELGVGGNPSVVNACLDVGTAYSIVDARIYSGALTEAQVKTAYEECTNQVMAGEEVIEALEPYFDLDFEDGVAKDAQNNTTVTSIGNGKVEKKIFEINGKSYQVDAYNADKSVEGDHSYLQLQMNDVTTFAQMKEWIMSGITFECYVWVETMPTVTTYYMGNMLDNGGLALTTRKKAPGALNFQMSSTLPDTARFKYDSMFVTAFPSLNKVKQGDADYELALQYQTFDAGQLNHIVGTYDKETNMMSVYKNGELIGSGDYGTGTLESGKASAGYITPGVLGIGGNPASLKGLAGSTAYSIVDARIYSGALTEAQVQTAYEECTNQVLANEITVPEDIEVTQLDDLSGYESLTGNTTQEMAGLPDYVYNTYDNGYLGKYEGCIEGMGASNGVDDLKTHIFSETDNLAYLSWLKSLESAGWTQYSNNIIEGKNLFATYTKGEQSVYAYYIANKGETRIIVQENVNLENRAVDNQYESICEPLLTPVRLTHIVKNSGMGYIMRLSDGRFIVIDGGADWGDDAEKIYKIMQDQNKLDKITIAAWIFTHAHEDHVWGPTAFLENYSKDCVIEEFIFNFPRRQDAVAFSEAYTTIYDPLFEAITTYWPDTKTVTCHTGQEYYFADTKLEFLHTIEDFYPEKPSTTTNFNNSSAVFTMETGGQKILITGDSYTGSNNNIITMWGDYIKSDILQVTHHGLGGGVVELYELVDPETALIPASRHYMTKPELDTGTKMAMAYAHTQWIVNNGSGNIKEVIAAGLEQRTLTLPYHPAEGVEYINWNQNGYEFMEPEKSEVAVPRAYMELDFANGKLANSGSGNVSFSMNGGTIGKNTVYYKDEAYEVTSYRAEKGSGNHILLTLEDMLSESDMEDLYTNGGCTFETFVALDNPTESNVGLLSSCNGGGAGLFMRTVAGTFMFQLANTSQTGDYYNSNYSYAGIKNERDVANVPAGKTVAHLVGTYDSTTNMLRMYHNGVLVSEQNYGDTGYFKTPSTANAAINVLGIGINAAMPSEILAKETGYSILESRIYDSCLSEEQVAASYWRDIEALGEDSVGETNVTEDENGAGITFLGGSLRMDYEDYDKTSFRFGYKITLPEGATLNSWGWSYTTVDPSVELIANGVNKIVNSDGTISTNLVITEIPKNYYNLVITAKMKIEYTLDGNVYTLEETVVRERSVNIVANSILESNEATQKEKDYANYILQ